MTYYATSLKSNICLFSVPIIQHIAGAEKLELKTDKCYRVSHIEDCKVNWLWQVEELIMWPSQNIMNFKNITFFVGKRYAMKVIHVSKFVSDNHPSYCLWYYCLAWNCCIRYWWFIQSFIRICFSHLSVTVSKSLSTRESWTKPRLLAFAPKFNRF